MYVSNPSSGCPDGLGCCGMGALTMDGTGLLGTGLFASGLDLTQWGLAEYIAGAFGLFVLYSVFSTTKRGYRSATRKVKYVTSAGERRRKERAEKLRSEARKLEGDTYKPRKGRGDWD